MSSGDRKLKPLGLEMAVEIDMNVLSCIGGGRSNSTTTTVSVGLSTEGGDLGDVNISFD